MAYRAFDIFCGAGGSSWGASMAGAQVVGGIDLWETAADTFKLNFPEARDTTYKSPIRELDPAQVARKVGDIDLLLASPECTNHSVAKGNGHRSERSRQTAFSVIKFAREWLPQWIVIENVVAMQKWKSYGSWLKRLQKLGYHTKELKLNAEDFGVPQSRRRLFVVCDLDGPPGEPKTRAGMKSKVESVLRRLGSRARASNGYNYDMKPVLGAGRADPTIERFNNAKEAIGPKKPFLLVYYGSDAAGGWQTLDRPLRTITTLDRFALVEPNGGKHVMRMLQPPELAAAMGFPKNYRWPKTTRRERIKLIGNAVAPPVMKAIVKGLKSGPVD